MAMRNPATRSGITRRDRRSARAPPTFLRDDGVSRNELLGTGKCRNAWRARSPWSQVQDRSGRAGATGARRRVRARCEGRRGRPRPEGGSETARLIGEERLKRGPPKSPPLLVPWRMPPLAVRTHRCAPEQCWWIGRRRAGRDVGRLPRSARLNLPACSSTRSCAHDGEAGGRNRHVGSTAACAISATIMSATRRQVRLVQFTRQIAVRYAPPGIFNTVIPAIKTPLLEHRVSRQKGRADLVTLRREAETRVPLGRRGDAWDVAYAALFLASDEANTLPGRRFGRW